MTNLHQQYLSKHYHKLATKILSGKLSPTDFAKNLTQHHLEIEAKIDYDGLIENFLNHSGFIKSLKRELELIQREDKINSAFLSLDIDHLKKFNDTNGHTAGDKLIKTYAKVIDVNLRVTDLKGRLGGDEFAAFLRGANLENARVAAERIRIGIIKEVKKVFPKLKYDQTISIGVTQIKGSDSVEDLRIRADQALYKAKKEKNKVVTL